MYALVKIAGRQYRVAPDMQLKVAKLDAEPEGEVVIPEVLMISEGDRPEFGAPTLPYRVRLEVLAHGRYPKVFHYHFKRRGGRRRLHGHRQDWTLVKVSSIEKGE
jgi:large subunit ribosomal protein L21